MIFIIVGSQKFQFNRLLKEVDKLIEEKKISEDVFAQIGYSDYCPKYYAYKKFINKDEFLNIMIKSNKVITHGGIGSIMESINNRKKTIAIPRLKKFGEHVDDHQIQIINEFLKSKLIVSINKIENLEEAIKSLEDFEVKNYISSNKNIIDSIDDFIQKNV